MQAEVDISDSEVSIKECVVDGSQAHFLIITKDAVIRLLMNSNLLEQTVNLIRLALPENCKSIENKKNPESFPRKFDMTLKAVDVRVGSPAQYRGPAKPELRWYTGKKRKHSIQMKLSWGQLSLLYDSMRSMQKQCIVPAT